MIKEEKNFDVRVIEKKIAGNEIKKEEYQNFLNDVKESEDYQVIDEEKILKLCGMHNLIKKPETENEE